MRKMLYYILTFILILSSCKYEKKENTKTITNYLIPRDNIACILDSFLLENGTKDSIYEIYINNISTWEYDVLIFSGRYSLIESSQSIGKTKVNNVVFNVYSGLDHYFKTSNNNLQLDESATYKGAPSGNYWIIHDSIYQKKILKTHDPIQYNQLPHRISKLNFIPPTIK